MNSPGAEEQAEEDGEGGEGGEGIVARLVTSQKRHARDLVSDMVRMRGLMPLLMKHRNGGSWTAEEREYLLMQLRVLSRISPSLLLLLLPGSVLLLPLYAWWLDRRRQRRRPTLERHDRHVS